MPEAPKARRAPRGGLRVRIGVVLGLAALQALGGRSRLAVVQADPAAVAAERMLFL
jgi:hypothetical protein